MNHKEKSKRILKMIINIILLLSLTGCESCNRDEGGQVTINNNSSKSIKASVLIQSNPNREGIMIAPGGSQRYSAYTDYTVRVQVMDNWISWAKGRREKLISQYNANLSNSTKKLSQQEMSEIKKEVEEITQKIDTYVPSSQVKTCYGFVKGMDGKSQSKGAYVRDSGSDSAGISLECD
jgi:hypothetical protein